MARVSALRACCRDSRPSRSVPDGLADVPQRDDSSYKSVNDKTVMSSVDGILLPFLRSTHPEESETLLTQLICEQADPIIHSVVAKKLHTSLSASQGSLRNQDALEIASGVRLLLLSELRCLKINPGGRTIESFHGYVAIKTYAACADYFRQKHPGRWRLKNRLRYQLKKDRLFALWQNQDGRWLCGFRHWLGKPPVTASVDGFCRSLGDEEYTSPEALLHGVFERAGHPLELDQLVGIAAEVWGIRDQPAESYDDPVISETLADGKTGIDAVLTQRSQLERLWEEVGNLPVLQRAALLLNLRDAQDGGVIAFLPYLNIASKAEIAETIGMPPEQFANLWNDLPLDDLRIAQMFGITRQQVINLRKTARERLARRVKETRRSSAKPPAA